MILVYFYKRASFSNCNERSIKDRVDWADSSFCLNWSQYIRIDQLEVFASISFTNTSFLSYWSALNRFTYWNNRLELGAQFANVIPELILFDIGAVAGHACVREVVFIGTLAYVAIFARIRPRHQNLLLLLGRHLWRLWEFAEVHPVE